MTWRAHRASLRQQGSLAACFTDGATEGWRAEPRTTRGGPPWRSSLAILAALALALALALWAAFRLALRQTDGLTGSVIGLPGLDLAAPGRPGPSRQAEMLEASRPQPSRDREPLCR